MSGTAKIAVSGGKQEQIRELLEEKAFNNILAKGNKCVKGCCNFCQSTFPKTDLFVTFC